MTNHPLLWTQPHWIAGAQQWIEQSVRAAGLRLTGPVEQPHVRPWSTVMVIPTDGGLFYFKANMPLLAFEARLTQALAARSPDCTPEILAANLDEGWMITRHAGTPLRALLHTPEDLHLLDPILPRLAEVQMAWLNRQEDLLALGVLDHQIERLPADFERLAADRTALMVGKPEGLTEAQYENVKTQVPVYAGLCAQLSASSIPQSIHYDDMHSSNVFLRVEGAAARLTFSDWGDSCVGHPFSSLLIFLRAICDLMKLPEEATQTPEGLPPMLARLRDVYLEPWQVYDNHANLVKTFNLAWWVGMVSRALSWHANVQVLPEPYQAEYRYTVPAWLGEFLLSLPVNGLNPII